MHHIWWQIYHQCALKTSIGIDFVLSLTDTFPASFLALERFENQLEEKQRSKKNQGEKTMLCLYKTRCVLWLWRKSGLNELRPWYRPDLYHFEAWPSKKIWYPYTRAQWGWINTSGPLRSIYWHEQSEWRLFNTSTHVNLTPPFLLSFSLSLLHSHRPNYPYVCNYWFYSQTNKQSSRYPVTMVIHLTSMNTLCW